MLAETPTTPENARAALADEWRRADPRTEDQILDFYRTAERMGPDLDAFHIQPARQAWTALICDVAIATNARAVVDIGCGAGHDLRALRSACPGLTLAGVEPNAAFRRQLQHDGFVMTETVEDAAIEAADLLVCIDVLEHVPDPEGFLGAVARRAKLGALLVESAATCDLGTPLHLRSTRGWRSGRALETAGWERTHEQGRCRVWQRVTEAPRVQHTGLALCAYRGVSTPTFRSVVNLIRGDAAGRWRVMVAGEAGIARARSQVTSWWHTETADDVLLMVDDDIAFAASDAERLVARCRDGYDVICAAYPTRDATHLALRGDGRDITFGPDKEPVEIGCVATGFVAFHRRVIDALTEMLPVVNANLEANFRPYFDFRTVPNEQTGGYEWLSEDYDFSEKAKAAGFPIWLDPSIVLRHQAQVELHVGNMRAVRSALDGGG